MRLLRRPRWRRRDPLRALLDERLRQLRERAAREPGEVDPGEVVKLWSALKAHDESRRVPRAVFVYSLLALALMVTTLAFWPLADANTELTGVATGFTFQLAGGAPSPLFPGMPLASLRAVGLDRLLVDGHTEVESASVAVGPDGQTQLLAPLAGPPGTSVRLQQSVPGVLALTLDGEEPVSVGFAGDPEDVIAEEHLADLQSPALLELFPADGEPLVLELEPAAAKPNGDLGELTLAQRVPVRSLRFEETVIDHEHPERTRTVGTVREALLGFPDLRDTTRSIARGARLQLDELDGVLDYWLDEEGRLAFRYEGRVGEAKLRARGSEEDRELIPSRLEALRNDRRKIAVTSSVLSVIATFMTLLQLRRLV